MYKEFRFEGSTPEGWARNFALSKKISFIKRLKIRVDKRYNLIQKYFKHGGKILDAGCGFGEWVSYLNGKHCVISWGVIEHNEAGPETALSEIYRILKPGGYAIVTVPFEDALAIWSSKLQVEIETRKSPPVFFQYYMTTQELRDYMLGSRFEVIDVGLHPQRPWEKFYHIFIWAQKDFREYTCSSSTSLGSFPTGKLTGIL